MKSFADLYERLDRTRSTIAKVEALKGYFKYEAPASAAWAVYFLAGERLKRVVRTSDLRQWCQQISGLPPWLFDKSYERVGDLAETIALVLPDTVDGAPNAIAARAELHPADEPRATLRDCSLAQWVEEHILPLRSLEPEQQQGAVASWWSALPHHERFLLNKLLTGALRVGVSKGLVIRALSQHAGLDEAVMARRLMGKWEPSAESFAALLKPALDEESTSSPYPFFLASPLEKEPQTLGPISEWQLEWKWDGIRGQLIRRAGESFLWSRGEELVGHSFPEVMEASTALPDGTVLDGEILAWTDNAPLPFATLQRRLGRKKPSKKIQEAAPVTFLAYDLLEHEGRDIRSLPLTARRSALESLIKPLRPQFALSEVPTVHSWEEAAALREQSRVQKVEGLMLKQKSAPYRAGRKRGTWWKWKVSPFSIDTVLLYAQAGHGRRANLYTDYTLAVWNDEGMLVPVAKAYSGLTDKEITILDRWIRKNTLERFGPVRSVKPHQVLEIAFENIAHSPRHKSGIALRFPRILRWRSDKPAEEANTLEDLKVFLG